MGPQHKSHRGTWRAKQENQSWGSCWSLGRDRRPWVPLPNAEMAPRGPQDKMLLCSEVHRVTKQEGEGCWSLPADPPTHSPPSSVPRRLASEDRIPQGPGFPTAFSPVGPHQAKIGGQEERRASSMTCPGQGLEAAGARPAPPALGAVAAPTARLSVPLQPCLAPSPTPLPAVPTVKSPHRTA